MQIMLIWFQRRLINITGHDFLPKILRLKFYSDETMLLQEKSHKVIDQNSAYLA